MPPGKKSKMCIGMNWVQCDKCDRYDVFENTGIEGEYDQKVIETLMYECRVCVWQRGVFERLDGLANELKEVKKRLTEVEERVEWVNSVKEKCLNGKEQQDESVVVERVNGLEKELSAVVVRVVKVEKSVECVRVVKEECLSVKVQQGENAGVSLGAVNDAGGKVTELSQLGGQMKTLEKTLAEIGDRGRRLEAVAGSMKHARVSYAAMVASKTWINPRLRVEGRVSSAAGTTCSKPVVGGGMTATDAAGDGAGVVADAVGGGAGVDASIMVGAAAVGAVTGSDGGGAVSGNSAGVDVGVAAGMRVIVEDFAEKSKQYEKGTVLLVGDSLVRGVGEHLKQQAPLFGKLDFGGARIEHIGENLEELGDRPDRNVVVMVGTNNLQRDGVGTMVAKYTRLVNDLKARNYRKVSLVGILKRRDSRFDLKVKETNSKLKELCVKEGVGFVEPAVDTRTMLCKDGVHLNWRGCNRVARAIFEHSCIALNLM